MKNKAKKLRSKDSPGELEYSFDNNQFFWKARKKL